MRASTRSRFAAPDGSTVEVHLNAAFEPVGTQADEDNGSENEQDGEN